MLSGPKSVKNSIKSYEKCYSGIGDKPIIVTRNEIRENVTNDSSSGAIELSKNVVINENNILDNEGFEIANSDSVGSENKNATNNWWGTTDVLDIRSDNLDFFKDASRGIIDIEPVASGPFTVEGIPLPFTTSKVTPTPTPTLAWGMFVEVK